MAGSNLFVSHYDRAKNDQFDGQSALSIGAPPSVTTGEKSSTEHTDAVAIWDTTSAGPEALLRRRSCRRRCVFAVLWAAVMLTAAAAAVLLYEIANAREHVLVLENRKDFMARQVVVENIIMRSETTQETITTTTTPVSTPSTNSIFLPYTGTVPPLDKDMDYEVVDHGVAAAPALDALNITEVSGNDVNVTDVFSDYGSLAVDYYSDEYRGARDVSRSGRHPRDVSGGRKKQNMLDQDPKHIRKKKYSGSAGNNLMESINSSLDKAMELLKNILAGKTSANRLAYRLGLLNKTSVSDALSGDSAGPHVQPTVTEPSSGGAHSMVSSGSTQQMTGSTVATSGSTRHSTDGSTSSPNEEWSDSSTVITAESYTKLQHSDAAYFRNSSDTSIQTTVSEQQITSQEQPTASITATEDESSPMTSTTSDSAFTNFASQNATVSERHITSQSTEFEQSTASITATEGETSPTPSTPGFVFTRFESENLVIAASEATTSQSTEVEESTASITAAKDENNPTSSTTPGSVLTHHESENLVIVANEALTSQSTEVESSTIPVTVMSDESNSTPSTTERLVFTRSENDLVESGLGYTSLFPVHVDSTESSGNQVEKEPTPDCPFISKSGDEDGNGTDQSSLATLPTVNRTDMEEDVKVTPSAPYDTTADASGSTFGRATSTWLSSSQSSEQTASDSSNTVPTRSSTPEAVMATDDLALRTDEPSSTSSPELAITSSSMQSTRPDLSVQSSPSSPTTSVDDATEGELLFTSPDSSIGTTGGDVTGDDGTASTVSSFSQRTDARQTTQYQQSPTPEAQVVTEERTARTDEPDSTSSPGLDNTLSDTRSTYTELSVQPSPTASSKYVTGSTESELILTSSAASPETSIGDVTGDDGLISTTSPFNQQTDVSETNQSQQSSTFAPDSSTELWGDSVSPTEETASPSEQPVTGSASNQLTSATSSGITVTKGLAQTSERIENEWSSSAETEQTATTTKLPTGATHSTGWLSTENETWEEHRSTLLTENQVLEGSTAGPDWIFKDNATQSTELTSTEEPSGTSETSTEGASMASSGQFSSTGEPSGKHSSASVTEEPTIEGLTTVTDQIFEENSTRSTGVTSAEESTTTASLPSEQWSSADDETLDEHQSTLVTEHPTIEGSTAEPDALFTDNSTQSMEVRSTEEPTEASEQSNNTRDETWEEHRSTSVTENRIADGSTAEPDQMSTESSTKSIEAPSTEEPTVTSEMATEEASLSSEQSNNTDNETSEQHRSTLVTDKIAVEGSTSEPDRMSHENFTQSAEVPSTAEVPSEMSTARTSVASSGQSSNTGEETSEEHPSTLLTEKPAVKNPTAEPDQIFRENSTQSTEVTATEQTTMTTSSSTSEQSNNTENETVEEHQSTSATEEPAIKDSTTMGDQMFKENWTQTTDFTSAEEPTTTSSFSSEQSGSTRDETLEEHSSTSVTEEPAIEGSTAEPDQIFKASSTQSTGVPSAGEPTMTSEQSGSTEDETWEEHRSTLVTEKATIEGSTTVTVQMFKENSTQSTEVTSTEEPSSEQSSNTGNDNLQDHQSTRTTEKPSSEASTEEPDQIFTENSTPIETPSTEEQSVTLAMSTEGAPVPSSEQVNKTGGEPLEEHPSTSVSEKGTTEGSTAEADQILTENSTLSTEVSSMEESTMTASLSTTGQSNNTGGEASEEHPSTLLTKEATIGGSATVTDQMFKDNAMQSTELPSTEESSTDQSSDTTDEVLEEHASTSVTETSTFKGLTVARDQIFKENSTQTHEIDTTAEPASTASFSTSEQSDNTGDETLEEHPSTSVTEEPTFGGSTAKPDQMFKDNSTQLTGVISTEGTTTASVSTTGQTNSTGDETLEDHRSTLITEKSIIEGSAEEPDSLFKENATQSAYVSSTVEPTMSAEISTEGAPVSSPEQSNNTDDEALEEHRSTLVTEEPTVESTTAEPGPMLTENLTGSTEDQSTEESTMAPEMSTEGVSMLSSEQSMKDETTPLSEKPTSETAISTSDLGTEAVSTTQDSLKSENQERMGSTAYTTEEVPITDDTGSQNTSYTGNVMSSTTPLASDVTHEDVASTSDNSVEEQFTSTSNEPFGVNTTRLSNIITENNDVTATYETTAETHSIDRSTSVDGQTTNTQYEYNVTVALDETTTGLLPGTEESVTESAIQHSTERQMETSQHEQAPEDGRTLMVDDENGQATASTVEEVSGEEGVTTRQTPRYETTSTLEHPTSDAGDEVDNRTDTTGTKDVSSPTTASLDIQTESVSDEEDSSTEKHMSTEMWTSTEQLNASWITEEVSERDLPSTSTFVPTTKDEWVATSEGLTTMAITTSMPPQVSAQDNITSTADAGPTKGELTSTLGLEQETSSSSESYGISLVWWSPLEPETTTGGWIQTAGPDTSSDMGESTDSVLGTTMASDQVVGNESTSLKEQTGGSGNVTQMSYYNSTLSSVMQPEGMSTTHGLAEETTASTQNITIGTDRSDDELKSTSAVPEETDIFSEDTTSSYHDLDVIFGLDQTTASSIWGGAEESEETDWNAEEVTEDQFWATLAPGTTTERTSTTAGLSSPSVPVDRSQNVTTNETKTPEGSSQTFRPLTSINEHSTSSTMAAALDHGSESTLQPGGDTREWTTEETALLLEDEATTEESNEPNSATGLASRDESGDDQATTSETQTPAREATTPVSDVVATMRKWTTKATTAVTPSTTTKKTEVKTTTTKKAVPKLPCFKTWIHWRGNCYKQFPWPVPWTYADLFCRKRKATLASVHSEDENFFLMGRFGPVCEDGQCRAITGLHIGLSDIQREGQYVWSDGSKLDFQNWSSDQPSNSPPPYGDSDGENCVELRVVFGFGQWNDIGCSNVKRPFVCEAPAYEHLRRFGH